MTVQILIVGLGQIGTSIGLGLAKSKDKVKRVGHDRSFLIARQAEKMGALDKVAPNLPSAVRSADLVILSLPMDQIRETLELIAPDLQEGAAVMDTAPVKSVVAAWAGELIPPDRHYVGLTPVLNPAYLHTFDSGIEAARQDLFQGGLMGITSPIRTSSEAIKLAADLTRLLGATPLFADPDEMDGLMAATHILPQILAAALINSTQDQPGWREGQRVAGRAYAEVTSPIIHLSESRTLSSSALLNRENMLRVMDSLSASLHAIRSDIEEEDAGQLEERLERARTGCEKWWQLRKSGKWSIDESAPAPGEDGGIFARLMGLRGKPKPKNKK